MGIKSARNDDKTMKVTEQASLATAATYYQTLPKDNHVNIIYRLYISSQSNHGDLGI
jgi:hypothetical protein